MKELLFAIRQYPISLLFGFGPDSILSYFSEVRSSDIDAYFPRSMFIDSSHNIFIDIIFQYGIFPLLLLFRVLYKNREHLLSSSLGISLLIGSLFLLFNVFIISHIIFGVLCIVFIQRTLQNKKIQENTWI